MKKYTFALVLSIITLVAVNSVFAGGGFDDYTLNADGTVKSVNADGAVGTTGEVTYDEEGNVISQGADAAGALKALGSPKGVAAIVIVLLIAGGLSYWSYKKSQPTI